MSSGSRSRWQDDDMDMTPMVDVTFLLLIFFMITSAFQMQKSFQVPTPRSDQASTNAKTLEDYEEDPDFVTVRIDEYNNFFVAAASWDEEKEAPSVQDLLIRLRLAQNADGPRASRLLILANGEADHERVVQAIDAGNEVGLEDVKLVTVEGDY
jgi:biopolymer transport protein ExbD